MKKLSGTITAGLVYLSVALPSFAQSPTPGGVLDSSISAPEGRIIAANTPIGTLVSFLVAFIIVIAFLAALIFIVIGAFQWITSGGDKDKVAGARNHIIAAVIGLVVIALSFVIINVVISALGLGSLTNLSIPTLTEFTGQPSGN